MHHTLVNYQRIYEKLGYLFYALASVDRSVAPREADKLREMVKENWLPVDDSTDEFGTDAGYYIDISFEYLLNEGADPEDAFREFEDYFTVHQEAFSKSLLSRIRATANALAHAYKGKNKKESALLKRLNRLLDAGARERQGS